ncbi:hypothetical protein [Streptomyces puniciscabiei]|uniref:hypothetical protein n=1 Tax=Streptomyces puniciscabiei TaxID=164348 RepID=UPI0037B4FC7A
MALQAVFDQAEGAVRPLGGVGRDRLRTLATTAVRFFQTLGASGFGALLSRLYDGPGGVGSLAVLRGADRAAGVAAYVSALDTVFLCGVAVMALSVLLALRLPGTRPARSETVTHTVAACRGPRPGLLTSPRAGGRAAPHERHRTGRPSTPGLPSAGRVPVSRVAPEVL